LFVVRFSYDNMGEASMPDPTSYEQRVTNNEQRVTIYAELHLHSAFSFLDGASLPGELVERAVELGYCALALTDHDGLHGAMELAQAAKSAGIQPITGAEVTLADGSHLTLLAETPAGYANLSRLIAHAHLTSPRLEPRLELAVLREHVEGIILLTGCREGELARLVDAGQLDAARTVLRRYREWCGAGNVFVELQQNLVHGDTPRIARLAGLAEEVGLPVVATGNVHYHVRERHRLQDVLVAVRHRTTLDASHALRRANSEFFLQPQDAMARRFRRYPEALRNTLGIAERCAGFDLTRDLRYRFPEYDEVRVGMRDAGCGIGNSEIPGSAVPSPNPASRIPHPDPDLVLTSDTRRLLRERYGDNPVARERLELELALVAKHGLAGFFLVYRDIMQLARQVAREVRGSGARAAYVLPPGRGRGSSVSSIICYLIGLSHIDPLRHNLFIGRFLNEELASVPDIDLDFPRDIREKLIERIYQVYGNDRAALVCAFPTYHVRSAIRDIGKALGLPAPDLDRLAKLSERTSADRLAEEMGRLPEFRDRIDAPIWRELVELARQIAGFPRHVTQHSGGMVISSQPLVELVPVQPAAMAGRYVCQWDKDSCDDARFIKIDFLALGMLSLVEECLELIVRQGKQPVDLSRIDFEDPNVYAMIGKGDTIGVFQIESRAQIQTLVRTIPRNLEDLIVQVAIVRPGPIVGGAVSPYVRARQQLRREGVARPEYDHPLLEPVLRETHGVILYQEQVLEVAIRLAGFTAGQADSFRRSMSRKRSLAAMNRFWELFRDGAAANGVDEATARIVFDKLLGFAAYGFPKAHAAAFAVLAYQSCWLKHYYPAEFYCALFNNQPMGFYPPHAFANDAQRHGTPVLPPDVNLSGSRCSVEGDAVRIGFNYVEGIGEDVALAIEQERARGGPYRSLLDLARRTRLRREVLEHLILVGACDGFGLRRRELLWQIGLFLPDRRRGPRAGPSAWQLALDLPTQQDMVTLADMTDWERMIADYDLLGISPRYHPIGLLRLVLPPNLVRAAELEQLRDGSFVRLAGLVVCRQRPGTAKGMLFMLLEDETGLANVIVHPPLYERRRTVIRGNPFQIITGRLQLRDNTVNIIASDVQPIERPDPTGPVVRQPISELLAQADRLAALPGEIDAEKLTHLRLVTPAAHDFR
jgi:error-prone DNA polymerase